MASLHPSFLAAGVRLFAVSVDSPGQQTAMIEKLDLPFPLLSDPDRSRAIEPLGLSDPDDPRGISRPALVLIDPDGQEVWRFVSRDFADRMPEQDVLDRATDAGWAPTTQDRPATGEADPGQKAMPRQALTPYFRGARFAALAMGLRHRHLDESIAEDSKAYVAEMDRYLAAVQELNDPT